eukprot:1158446-Pelagomonas_calceolata.AAC.6
MQIFDGMCWVFLKLQIDDPLCAAPMHGWCGIWAVLFVGLLAKQCKEVYRTDTVQTVFGTARGMSGQERPPNKPSPTPPHSSPLHSCSFSASCTSGFAPCSISRASSCKHGPSSLTWKQQHCSWVDCTYSWSRHVFTVHGIMKDL